ncbi:hypothetical protein OIE67_19780 [Nonomuraea fuscirosea]|uniref:hypothetical protein n=1 Tax=Nonomuraea fuscirosea TaxID=1291556 RepID=UPI002DD7C647|nr:hypothetical protein [Nonomuraea fuscirosea]WSA56769.1 hypothetical protein OIE67_19780 [Nonomuraea fuscirosea]
MLAAAGFVVDRDDQLADDVPVGKGEEPLVALQPGAGDPARQQALVHGSDVAQHVPDVLGGRVDDDLVADGGQGCAPISRR